MRIIILSSLVFSSFALGWFIHPLYTGHQKPQRYNQIREDSPKYNYINPLLFIDDSTIVYDELIPLNKELEKYIYEEKGGGKVKRISVYYRDLNSGIWTGVNPDDKFVPASTLKVAILMTYLKLAEDNPAVISRKLAYKKNPNERQLYPPAHELTDGLQDTNQLIWQTIIESDNSAGIALASAHEEELFELFRSSAFTSTFTQSKR